jgi:hypothetical protein
VVGVRNKAPLVIGRLSNTGIYVPVLPHGLANRELNGDPVRQRLGRSIAEAPVSEATTIRSSDAIPPARISGHEAASSVDIEADSDSRKVLKQQGG